MAKRPFVEFLLQLINFIFTLRGLGVLFYGLYILFDQVENTPAQPLVDKTKYVLAHRLLLAFDPSKLLPHKQLPTAWFLYLLITIGAVVFIISCCGYVGTASRSPFCLYSIFLVGLVLAELGVAAFMLFDHNWKEFIALFLAFYFRSVISRAKYDSSDDERIVFPRFLRATVGRKSSQASSTPSTSKEQIRPTRQIR